MVDEPELNGLGEQPEILVSQNNDSNGEDLIINTTEEQPKKVVQRFKYKELYEDAKDIAQWRLLLLRAAGIIAALGWSAFIISMVTR